MENLVSYIRLMLYPLIAFGLLLSAIIEFSIKKEVTRLIIMCGVSALLLELLALNLLAFMSINYSDIIRNWFMTPTLIILLISVWTYLIKRSFLVKH